MDYPDCPDPNRLRYWMRDEDLPDYIRVATLPSGRQNFAAAAEAKARTSGPSRAPLRSKTASGFAPEADIGSRRWSRPGRTPTSPSPNRPASRSRPRLSLPSDPAGASASAELLRRRASPTEAYVRPTPASLRSSVVDSRAQCESSVIGFLRCHETSQVDRGDEQLLGKTSLRSAGRIGRADICENPPQLDALTVQPRYVVFHVLCSRLIDK